VSGTVRVRVLGRLGVEHGTRWLDGSALPGRQGRIVLAYLALTHHPVARDDLADVVWRDALTASWERDLSAVVSKVRAALDSIGLNATLHGGFGCYELQLPPGSRVDAEDAVRFVEDAESAWRAGRRDVALPAASTAANLARRPLLPAEQGMWVERRRDALRETLLRALDVLVDGLAGGPYEHDALRYATEALALDPYRETGYVRLMRLHIGRGNRAEAVRAYEQCCAILARDLGVAHHRRRRPSTARYSVPDGTPGIHRMPLGNALQDAGDPDRHTWHEPRRRQAAPDRRIWVGRHPHHGRPGPTALVAC
jgi:SARP family transcriptional regulator, regulator of embCAB operon